MITKERKVKKKGKVEVKKKKRLIPNLKRSGITNVARKSERPELPRVLDVVFSMLELLRAIRGQPRRHLRQLVLDFAHAFFNFPGTAGERRYFATRLRNAIYVWLRIAQGSRGAPMICGRALAQAMRMACCVIDDGMMSAATYVDDPIATFAGTDKEIEVNMGKMMAMLLAMGYELAFSKAQDTAVEKRIVWTSAVIELLESEPGVKISIKPEILNDIGIMTDDMLAGGNLVPIESLRILAGKATCVSSLLHVWRPFVGMLWAPTFDSRSKCKHSPEHVWFRAVRIPPDLD